MNKYLDDISRTSNVHLNQLLWTPTTREGHSLSLSEIIYLLIPRRLLYLRLSIIIII